MGATAKLNQDYTMTCNSTNPNNKIISLKKGDMVWGSIAPSVFNAFGFIGDGTQLGNQYTDFVGCVIPIDKVDIITDNTGKTVMSTGAKWGIGIGIGIVIITIIILIFKKKKSA